jgi:large subunit ribosomal protein L15
MNIADITKAAGRKKPRKRVGRGPGSGRGKTSTRGHKGAGQRSGSTKTTLNEGGQMRLFRRFPKVGFSNFKFRTDYAIVNVSDLDRKFEAGDHVTAVALVEAGLIRNLALPIKILGNGDLGKKLVVEANKFSKSAEEKIKTGGGEAKVIHRRSAESDKK